MADLKRAHIWAANFGGFYQKEKFFEENYSDEDDEPINEFAKSQGAVFYDHDNFFVEGVSNRSVEEVLEPVRIFDKNREAIIEAWHSFAGSKFNTMIIGDEEYFPTPRSCRVSDVELFYIGSFPFYGKA